MKPRFKLGSSGRVYLLQAGLSGMDEEQTRQYMKRQCGSVLSYCLRHGLPYDATLGALRGYTVRYNSSKSAMRALLGLPWKPDRERMNFSAVSSVYKCIVQALDAADPENPQPVPIQIGEIPKKVAWEPSE